MSEVIWNAVDEYITGKLIPNDADLTTAQTRADQAGLPEIQVAPNQGQLLAIMAHSTQAQSILEIGTLGGYSTIWLAKTLPPSGKLITLEYDPKHARVAQENIDRAGLADKVEIRVGRAVDSLPQIASEGLTPFDFIFIDADKDNSDVYFDWALKLSRVGTLIITDNVVRNGEITNPNTEDGRVRGIQRLFDRMANEPRILSTAVQTVGSKGYDGLAVALVIA